jgi:hypothetical protein
MGFSRGLAAHPPGVERAEPGLGVARVPAGGNRPPIADPGESADSFRQRLGRRWAVQAASQTALQAWFLNGALHLAPLGRGAARCDSRAQLLTHDEIRSGRLSILRETTWESTEKNSKQGEANPR